MRGHIRKRGKHSWAVVLDLGKDPVTGKRRQKWHSVKGTKRDAEQELARLLNEIRTSSYVEPSSLTVGDYLNQWLETSAKRKTSPKTFDRYTEIVTSNLIPGLGGSRLQDLNPLQIQEFYSKALESGRKDGKGGLSPQSVLHFHRLLHKALDQAVKWQLLTRNPASAVEPPRPQRKPMRALDPDETASLLKLVSGTRLFIPVLLAVTGGLRRGEILALRWQEIELETGHVVVARSLEQTKDGLRTKVPKSEHGRRTIVLPRCSIDELRTHRTKQAKLRLALGPAYQDHDLVAPREDGTPWPPDVFSTAFAALVRRSDLNHFRFHDLRHTHATHLLSQGVHPKIVSERLGHSNIGITLDTYSHVLPGIQGDAIHEYNRTFVRTIIGRV